MYGRINESMKFESGCTSASMARCVQSSARGGGTERTARERPARAATECLQTCLHFDYNRDVNLCESVC